MQLYKQYIAERDGQSLIYAEDCFVAFKLLPKEAFICDLYVVPGKRRSGLCQWLIDQVEDAAKAKGIRYITGTIRQKDNGKFITLEAADKLGFKVMSENSEDINIIKEI